MIDGMVAKLTAHLRDEPDDAQGWAMLGRSYVVLQRFADATKAYARANALSVEQPQAEWLVAAGAAQGMRSEEHTSELQSLMRSSYAVFCLKQKKKINKIK